MDWLRNWFDTVLIPEWRSAMQYLSVKWNVAVLMVLGTLELVQITLQAMDMQQQAELMEALFGPYGKTILAVVSFITLMTRLKAQPSLHQQTPPPPSRDSAT